MKDNLDKMNQRDDGNSDAESVLKKQYDSSEDAPETDSKNKLKTGSSSVDLESAGPVYLNWKKILKKMIPKGSSEVEDTYSKMSRQTTSSMVTSMQTGAGRIAPGEVTIENDKKGLVFVIDNSYSVNRHIKEFNKEILNLLKKNSKMLSNMYVIKFSIDIEVYKLDVKKQTYVEIKNPEVFGDKKPVFEFGQKGKAIDIFKEARSAGTKYSNVLHNTVDYLHKDGMNVIMFTDDDLVYDKNFEKFFKFAKKKNTVGLLITDDPSYNSMVEKFGKKPWMSVIK